MHRSPAAATRTPLLFVGLVGLSLAAAGCNELSSRTLVQEGNSLYDNQEYEKAIAKYEKALGKNPGLGVIRHNLGLAYSRLFRAGVETPENDALAAKATEHLSWWLEKHPDDAKVRKYLLNFWISAGDYDRPLAYFDSEHKRDPQNREFVQKIAGLYNMKKDWRTAIDWYYKDAELAPDKAAKVAAYQTVANVAYNKLWTAQARIDLRGVERTEIAEIGLRATEQGLSQDDKHIPLTSMSQKLWEFRSIGQGPSWAYAIDRAEAQVFEQRVRVLKEEAKKNQPPPAGGTPPPAGATPPAGTSAGSGS